jgi:hypothetical protein
MHGTLTNDEQLKAFRPAPKGYRKVIFSTNVAETSVTISGIVYGKFIIHKTNFYNIILGFLFLLFIK